MENCIRFYTNKQSEEIIEILLNGGNGALELLENGISVNARNDQGDTALSIALNQDNVEAIKFLLDHGAEFCKCQLPLNLQYYHLEPNDALLLWAAEKGLEKAVEFMLERGANINARDRNSRNVLYLAARNGHQNLVEHLLNQELHGEINASHYPYVFAAVHGASEEMIELFLNQGEDVNSLIPHLGTPLHLASEKGFENIVKLLLERNADIWAKSKRGKTVLHSAASGGNINIVKLFLDLGLEANVRDNDGWTPLSCVDGSGSEPEKTILLLLTNGADVNTKMKEGPHKTILNFACANGYEEIVKLLLLKGADIIGEEYEWDPEMFNFMSDANLKKDCSYHYYNYFCGLSKLDKRKYYQTALHSASRSNNEEIIKLLILRGADPNAETSEGYRPLHIASRCGNGNIVKILIESGADVRAKNHKGETALHSAIFGGNEDILGYFLNQADIDIHDKGGYIGGNALHYAAYYGREQIIKILLNCGADIDAKTLCKENIENTPLKLASCQGHLNVVELFLKHGVKYCFDENDLNWVDWISMTEEVQRMFLDNKRANIDPTTDFGLETFTSLFELFNEVSKFEHEYYCDNSPNTNVLGRRKCKDARKIEQMLDCCVNANLKVLFRYMTDKNGSDFELLLDYQDDFNLAEGANYMHSGVYEAFSGEKNTIAKQLIIRHVVKMLSQNQSVSQQYLDDIDSNEVLKSYQIKCNLEIEKMKKEVFDDTTASPYNIVICKNPTRLAALAGNDKVLQQVSSVQCLVKYPIYASALNNQLRRGKWRFFLLKAVSNFFTALTKSEGNEYLPKLPVVCVRMIYSYLSNSDLKTLMLVCNVPTNIGVCDVTI